MNDLSPKERDLLERVKEKPELRTLFFRKIKGLKWFDALQDLGYFNVDNIPAPIPGKEEGYVSIPRWEVVDYLVKTVQELVGQSAIDYAPHFLNIMVGATAHAKANGFGNYHVWWQFSEVLSHVPTEFISLEHIDIVDYWLDDKYERGLVTEVIGVKWLPKLLEQADSHSMTLALRLIEILFDVSFATEKTVGRARKTANLRFDYHRAEKVTAKIAYLAGRRLGEKGVLVFQSKLAKVLDELGNDAWSSVWQSAVEEHEQNDYRHDAENILLEAYRDALCGLMDEHPNEAYEHVQSLLSSPYQTIERVAIYCIGQRFQRFSPLADTLIDDKYLQANFRHEIWHFLHRNYPDFTDAQKQNVLALIQGKVRMDEDGSVTEGASAYERSTWLAAIKDFGNEEAALYQLAVKVSMTEPDHPDFSSYMTSEWAGQKSPYSVEELSALSINDLVETLNSYKGGDGWREPGIEGLAKAVRQVFRNTPLKYSDRLASFSDLDLAYIYSIIEAYSELWSEKANLPWDELWQYLLAYIDAILKQDRFWDPANTEQRKEFVANRYWIVGVVARFLESGAKSDDHSFPAKYHDDVEAILKTLLQRERGEEFKPDSDAVSISINSPRGQCIQALINLALRACRLADHSNDGDHAAIWERYRGYFDAELERAENGEYEFATLITNYLPNFLYMRRTWVLENLPQIFDQTDYLKWSCAMQGYAYVNTVYREIYEFLRKHGDFLRVLDDEKIKDRVEEKVIQHIVVAYINNFEAIEDVGSLITALLKRADFEELSHLIWFIWTLRKEDDDNLTTKVYELWPLLLSRADLSRKEDRKLASNLCHWATFVDHVDDDRMKLLLTIAPYAGESHNSYDLLESLARISEKQPFEANEIWQRMLQGSAFDYPEEAIRKLLSNLVRSGHEGIRAARNTVSQYLKQGLTRPSEWLQEVIDSSVS
jgi:hypothetical protein